MPFVKVDSIAALLVFGGKRDFYLVDKGKPPLDASGNKKPHLGSIINAEQYRYSPSDKRFYTVDSPIVASMSKESFLRQLRLGDLDCYIWENPDIVKPK